MQTRRLVHGGVDERKVVNLRPSYFPVDPLRGFLGREPLVRHRRGVGMGRNGWISTFAGLKLAHDVARAIDQRGRFSDHHLTRADFLLRAGELLMPAHEAEPVLRRIRKRIPRDTVLIGVVGGQCRDALTGRFTERGFVLAGDLDADLIAIVDIRAVLLNELQAIAPRRNDLSVCPARLKPERIVPPQNHAVVCRAIDRANADPVIGQRSNGRIPEVGIGVPQRSQHSVPDNAFHRTPSEIVGTDALDLRDQAIVICRVGDSSERDRHELNLGDSGRLTRDRRRSILDDAVSGPRQPCVALPEAPR